jgi:hypothetical protein
MLLIWFFHVVPARHCSCEIALPLAEPHRHWVLRRFDENRRSGFEESLYEKFCFAFYFSENGLRNRLPGFARVCVRAWLIFIFWDFIF